MAVTLDQILALAGRLDDTPGFDTPRERFRRFLHEHVTSLDALRVLIAQCQHVPGEEHQRALQDLVAATGRHLGFVVGFGSLSAEGAVEHQGIWTTPQCSIVLSVRSAPSAPETIASLARAMASLPDGQLGSRRIVGLAVVTPLGNGRQKLEEAREALGASSHITVVGLDTLLSLADLVVAGHVTETDVAKLFRTDAPMDLVTGLVARVASQRLPQEPPAISGGGAPKPIAADVAEMPSYWLIGIVPDPAMSPEAFLELVVMRRHVFGVGETLPASGTVRAGDSLCLYLAGRGVVGQARVVSIVEDGGGIRDPRRFRQILRLADLAVHVERAIPLEPESELRLKAVRPIGKRPVQTLLQLSHERYVAMTAASVPAAAAPPAPDTPAAETA